MHQTWEGAATVPYQLVDLSDEDLLDDPVLTPILAELFPELAFNPIKHGGAKSIGSTISRSKENLISHFCSDNGMGHQGPAT